MTFEEADKRFPYDPGAREYRCKGIAKLACFDDPGMRRSVFEVWKATHPREAERAAVFQDDSERRYP